MASFLHVTDLHFGRPANSVGIGKHWKARSLPAVRSVATIMATHDRNVTGALADLIIELRDDLDAILLTGDIATTSASAALSAACTWLEATSAMADNKRMIALPGNHDRFHAFPSWPLWPFYRPGATAFDPALAAVPGVEVPCLPHDSCVVPLDKSTLLACIDLTLRIETEATPRSAMRSQGIVRDADKIIEKIQNNRTPQITHVVVATHFPLHPLGENMAAHACINGEALRSELLKLANELPVLLISGHLHRESHFREGDLFTLVGATTSQTLAQSKISAMRPRDLTVAGAHSAVAVRTEPGGFVLTRWRYGIDRTLTRRRRRFCEPTQIQF